MSKSFAMAVAVRPKSKKKKMAEGGAVNESAKYERRPMPDERDKDSKMVGRNSGNKAPSNDDWGSNITVKQAQKPSITKLSQPKIVGSDAFSVRNRDQRDENNNQIESFYPESDRAQPKQRYNEDGPNRQGPKVSDMEPQHKAKKAPYNKAIEDQYAQDMADAEMKKVQSYAEGGVVSPTKTKTSTSSPTKTDTKTSTTGNKTKTGGSNPGGASTGGAGTVTITTRDLGSKGINVSNVGGKTDSKNHGGMDPGDEDDDGQTMMARGGRVDMEPDDHGQEMEERDDEAHMMDELSSTEHGEQPAKWRDELDADDQNPNALDMERQHNNGRKAYAKGGAAMRSEDPDKAAGKCTVLPDKGWGKIIRCADGGMLGDEEQEIEHAASMAAAIMAKRRMMAEGGMIKSHPSIYSDESSQVDLSRNADEDANEEDQLSYNALRKENYSESEGLRQLDSPDDSNEHGHEIDSDAHDMVSAIRRKIKMKSAMSR